MRMINPTEITAVVALFTLIFSVIKYFQERKSERNNKEFEQFIIILDRVSGRYENGNLMVDIQQIAAIYQLLKFKQYKDISIPVLEYFIEQGKKHGNEGSDFYISARKVYTELKKM